MRPICSIILRAALTVSALVCRQEGPHSTIGEDEFFDAVESALDRITEDQEFRDKMRKKQSVKPSEAPKSSQHSLLQEVRHAAGVSAVAGGLTLAPRCRD